MKKRIATILELAESTGVTRSGLRAAEKAGLLAVYRAGGRRLVLPGEVDPRAIEYARLHDQGATKQRRARDG